MKEVYLQYWEESVRGQGVQLDGCSLHLSKEDTLNYINSIYSNRVGMIPHVYDRIIGEPISIFIKDDLFEMLVDDRVIRLFQYELNNLLKLEDIKIIC